MTRRDDTRALLLVGHGSSFGPEAGAPVRAHAERIRRLGAFDEVATAFVKEAPPLAGAIERIAAREVYVVPLFLAEGYYTRGVVPRALGIVEGPGDAIAGARVLRRTVAGRRVHYTPAVGSHPAMLRALERRALEALGDEAEPRDAALVVIGHGTDRHPASAETTLRLASRLRRRARFAEVLCGFLDQEPRIDRVVAEARARAVVLVPYFLAEGMHTRETIPELLALEGGRTERGGRVLLYARPVGTLPYVARLALDLARRAGARIAPRAAP